MKLKDWLLETFTWWHGQTIGTRFYTWRFGKRVGEDERGNVFYQNADGSRRWVVFNGPVEATAIGTGWHGWMHFRVDTCLLYTSPSPRDLSTSRMPSSA